MRNPSLLVTVRRRDGDNCRQCGVLVTWTGDRRGPRAGAYCLVDPTLQPSVENLVVMCGMHGRDYDYGSGEAVLNPVPSVPVYGEYTRRWLESRDEIVGIVYGDEAVKSDLQPVKGLELRFHRLKALLARRLVLSLVESCEVRGTAADDDVRPGASVAVIGLEAEREHFVGFKARAQDFLHACKVLVLYVVGRGLTGKRDDEISQDTSPSVGAPSGTGCGDLNPTGGDPLSPEGSSPLSGDSNPRGTDHGTAGLS